MMRKIFNAIIGALGVRSSRLHPNTAQSRLDTAKAVFSPQSRTNRCHHLARECAVGQREDSGSTLPASPPGCAGVGDGRLGGLPRRGQAGWHISSALGVASTFVLALSRLGWSAQSARRAFASTTVRKSICWPRPYVFGWIRLPLSGPTAHHWSSRRGPLFWQALRPLFRTGRLHFCTG